MSIIRHCLPLLLSLGLLFAPRPVAADNAAAKPQVWIRVTLLQPSDAEWRVHIVFHHPGPPYGSAKELYVGETVGDNFGAVKPIAAGQWSPWIDVSEEMTGPRTVRCLFEVPGEVKSKGVEGRFHVATAPEETAIIRSITDHDPGSTVSLRMPADPVKDKQWLLSIREDGQRRLDEVKALNLPAGPLPKKIWCMTGFRSNGQFYTDPAIAQTDFDIMKLLGMNGFWEQGGGQPGELRKFCRERDINYSTVYPRMVAAPPRDASVEGVRLDWKALGEFIDRVYQGPFAGDPKNPDGMPTVIADLMDEPDGIDFAGPEYQQEFRSYLAEHGLTPDFFAKSNWDELEMAKMAGWWGFWDTRYKLDINDIHARRLFYWSAKFWTNCVARLYAMATKRVEELGKNVIGTRVNTGPPQWYDYGTLPRGIDAFEFGRLRSVSLAFNEDWIGNGNPRWPLESNTFLMDWTRGALRPQNPLAGSYITRDANRTSVKLRVFGCLAREAKMFDFYYYGPSYTFFDHWSDNFPMVQGVAELTRDIGQADEILWEGKTPKPEVALLYSKSWPVWKDDDTEQCELMMAHLALLHAGIAADIVSDEEVTEGILDEGGYRCLYVVNESIPRVAAKAIEEWVRKGGRLWVSGWGGMRDEYNTPTRAWNGMLGIKGRSWKPTGDLTRLGQPIKPDDWMRPIFGRQVALQFSEEGQPEGSYQRQYGKGQVFVVPLSAGKDYLDACKQIDGPLAHAIIYSAGEKRDIIAKFALDSGVEPGGATSVSQILAWPLWTSGKGVVLIANFTGNPAEEAKVRFGTPLKVRKIRSLRQGDLKFTQPDPRHVECTLPVRDVTDMLIINE